MKHLEFSSTPITALNYFSDKLNCNIIAKRDDLFPEALGGNKARMLQYILADVNNKNVDTIITAGGPNSNFNRACALMCAKLGVKMHLIEYTDNIEEYKNSLNYFICNLSGISKTRCDKGNVPSTIESVIDGYKGEKVKFIYGGGKSLEGFYSYYDAVFELKKQVDKIDHLFISCGTGTTLTGICAGFQELYPNAKVHAISVARSLEAEMPVLMDDMNMLNQYLKKDYNYSNLSFYEQFLCGGYGKSTQELLNCIRQCIEKEGMIVDPCYSGKSFYGMNEIIQANPNEFRGKNILYWNTGGVINLLSMKEMYGYKN